MAVTMADITKLRKMSGAGMMDCKKALTESDGDKLSVKKDRLLLLSVLTVKLLKVAYWQRKMANSLLSSL